MAYTATMGHGVGKPDRPDSYEGATRRAEQQLVIEKRRLAKHPDNKRRRAQGSKLLWATYSRLLATGESVEEVAQHFGLSVSYTRDLISRARCALEAARMFNPNANNLHEEMLRFVPLAALSLEKNLIAGHPAVTIAFLQGVGALVPRAEISRVSEEERQEQLRRSSSAINPRLKRALGIEDGVEVTVDPEAEPA